MAERRPAEPPTAPPAAPITRRPGIRIAIDGPAASGKGTVARAVAQALGYRYLDTGAMYRALALRATEEGVDHGDEAGLARLASGLRFDFPWQDGQAHVIVDGRDVSRAIRTQAVGEGASAVAVHPAVRRTLVRLQQGLAEEGAVVMDGRDIGTVVLPDAQLKIYLDATIEERARRRWAELRDRGRDVARQDVLEELRRRDHQDSNRATGPLAVADDAVVVDTTDVPPDVVLRQILDLARQRGARLAASA